MLLEDRALYSLLDNTDLEREQRFKDLWKDAQAQLAAPATSNFVKKAIKFGKLGLFCKNHRKTLTRDLAYVWNKRGLHDSTRIREWLNKILENKKFADIRGEDLRIVVADTSERGYITYNKKDHSGTSIAEAVHASISIPLFFSPFRVGPMYLVDGGILSNYPSYQFAREPYPTIGFRIIDVTTPSAVDSTWTYLKSLLLTMVEAHDKERERALNSLSFKTYTIAVPTDIPATKFALTDDDVQTLYQAGQKIAPTVGWEKYSGTGPLISFPDPKPDEALESVLTEGRKLFDNYMNKELWVQKLRQEVTVTLTIEPDWSTRYEHIVSYVVQGDLPIFLHRVRLTASTLGAMAWLGGSLADVRPVYQEVLQTGVRDMIRIPAYNSKDRKEFVFFYIPPLTKADGARTFRASYAIDKEFDLTLGRGGDDTFQYGAAQRAYVHTLVPRFRVRVATDLPELVMSPEFPCTLKQEDDEFDHETQRPYRVHAYTPDQPDTPDQPKGRLNVTALYNIRLSRAG